MKTVCPILILLAMVLVTSCCEYRRGKSYTWKGKADTLDCIIFASGQGTRIQGKLSREVYLHESRGDKCRVIWVSDSAQISQTRGILLINTVLPDYSKDMLTRGFIGTLSTRQIITYLVVSRHDFEMNFTPITK